MTSLLFLLGVMVGQPGPDVKVSIRIVPAKPAADGKTIFAVEATVTDANGKPIANAPVRFGAEGYSQAPDGTIVGSYRDMKRDVDYQVLMPVVGLWGGLWNGRSVTNNLVATTDKNGIARVQYKPPPWRDYMARIPTRVTASYQKVDSTNIQFTKPKD